jgi:hypothetical protein
LPGQAMTLSTLPKGLDPVAGAVRQGLGPPNPEGVSTAIWKVKIGDVGRFPIRVVSSTGVAMTKTLIINRGEIGPGKIEMGLAGDIGVGKDKKFQVIATVTDPVPNQSVNLVLPPELVRLSDSAIKQVPPADKGKTSSVSWDVQVQKEGKFSIAVESSTGMTVKKTLSIVKGEEQPGKFQLDFVSLTDKKGYIPKKDEIFIVRATVAKAVPGQKLTLELPKEIELQEKDKFEKDVPVGGVVSWPVKIVSNGRLRIAVVSSAGLTKAKTIKIGGPGLFGN